MCFFFSACLFEAAVAFTPSPFRHVSYMFLFFRVPFLGLPVLPFYPFWGQGSPTKIDYGKKLVPTYSNLSAGGPSFSPSRRFFLLLERPGIPRSTVPGPVAKREAARHRHLLHRPRPGTGESENRSLGGTIFFSPEAWGAVPRFSCLCLVYSPRSEVEIFPQT